MAKGGSLKAALIQQQDRAARKAAQLKVQEAIERKEKSMNGGGNKQKSRKQSQLEKSIVRNEALSGPITESLKKPAQKPRQLTYPFDKTDTILLVGEGDFTFTLSLLSAPHSHPSHLVLATSYDSQQDCYSKYPNAQAVVEKIIELGGRVEWKVDAGGLERCKAVGKSRSWSRIVFNFPHAGAGIKDQDRNILTNQHLILSFFRSAGPLLTAGKPRLNTFGNVSRSGKKGEDGDEDRDVDAGDGDLEEADEAVDEDDDDDEDEPMKPLTDQALENDIVQEEEEEEEDLGLGIDINSYLAKHSHVEKLNSKSEPIIAPEDDDPRAFRIPRTQGSILITLKDSAPYTLWDIRALAVRPPKTIQNHPSFLALNKFKTDTIQPRYDVIRSFAFSPELYPGYAHVKTRGGKEEHGEVITRGGGLRTWEFGLKRFGRAEVGGRGRGGAGAGRGRGGAGRGRGGAGRGKDRR